VNDRESGFNTASGTGSLFNLQLYVVFVINLALFNTNLTSSN
jgi:hypothetical protein